MSELVGEGRGERALVVWVGKDEGAEPLSTLILTSTLTLTCTLTLTLKLKLTLTSRAEMVSGTAQSGW